jgi:hypothetical protein
MKPGDKVWYKPPHMKVAAVVVDPTVSVGLTRIRVECVDQRSHTIVPIEVNMKTEHLKPRRAWSAVDDMKG